MSHQAERFHRIDKEKFKRCLQPFSASQNRE